MVRSGPDIKMQTQEISAAVALGHIHKPAVVTAKDCYVQSNLEGRIRNTTLPKKHGMIPLFEAVVNSIHAIEERFADTARNLSEGKIEIIVERDSQGELDVAGKKLASPRIHSFEIRDNGVGFTDANWTSFNLLDSTHKIAKGCRGIGRLMWLKAFNYVSVTSNYVENDRSLTREFTFTSNPGVVGGEAVPRASGASQETSVRLIDFSKSFAEAVYKTTPTIARALLEHCLWYFVREGGVPSLVLVDGSESVDLNELFEEHMHAEALPTTFDVKGTVFEATHVKFRTSIGKRHVVSYCAGGRLVMEETPPNIPGLTGNISDDRGSFTYACYLTSEFLDAKVFEQRIGFDIEEEVEGLFAEQEITLKDIRTEVGKEILAFLGDSLSENKQAGAARLQDFISTKAPHYQPILAHVPDAELNIDPEATDRELDLLLHKHRYAIEEDIRASGHSVLQPKSEETADAYKERVKAYVERVQDVKQSDLAAYVMHRRVILDLLREALNRRNDGSFVPENVVHELIAPLRSTSEDIEFGMNNLWLVDERLSFHSEYLGSDKSLMSSGITSSSDRVRPDILSLNAYENPHLFSDRASAPQAAITVVEIKRPMRNDYSDGEDKNPIQQALGYLKRLREGQVTTRQGRPIANADRLPGYVYVLADLTTKLKEQCNYASLTESADGLRYFGFNPNYNAYIEVIDFEGLVDMAYQRNIAFFDRLGLPAKG